jgi:hypothetical protein
LLQVQRDYTIDIHGEEIFVQNVELQTHGFVTPDLGMGAYRNAQIINKVCGREVYLVEKKIAFQSFGAGASTPLSASPADPSTPLRVSDDASTALSGVEASGRNALSASPAEA